MVALLMTLMNDCQFIWSSAPLDKCGTTSNPASIPIAADCVDDQMSARKGSLGVCLPTGEELLPRR